MSQVWIISWRLPRFCENIYLSYIYWIIRFIYENCNLAIVVDFYGLKLGITNLGNVDCVTRFVDGEKSSNKIMSWWDL